MHSEFHLTSGSTGLVLPTSCMYRHIHVQPCMLYQQGKYQSCIKELIVHSTALLFLCIPQTPLPFPTGSGFRCRSSGLPLNLLYQNLHFNHRAPGHWQTQSSSEWSGLLEDLTEVCPACATAHLWEIPTKIHAAISTVC